MDGHSKEHGQSIFSPWFVNFWRKIYNNAIHQIHSILLKANDEKCCTLQYLFTFVTAQEQPQLNNIKVGKLQQNYNGPELKVPIGQAKGYKKFDCSRQWENQCHIYGIWNYPAMRSSCLYSLSWNTVLKERYHLFTTCQRVEGNFLSWLSEPTRGGTPLDLLLTNGQGLVGDVFKGCLGQRDHEMVRVFNTWWCKEGHQQNLDFQRVDFDLFKTLIRKVPWEAAIKNKRGSGRLNIL